MHLFRSKKLSKEKVSFTKVGDAFFKNPRDFFNDEFHTLRENHLDALYPTLKEIQIYFKISSKDFLKKKKNDLEHIRII